MLVNERPVASRNPKFDSAASLLEADSKLGLQRVIEQYGMGPKDGKWKSFECPFCKKKAKAGVYQHQGTTFFKCQSTSCATGAKAMTAVGFIAQVSGLSQKEAFIAYLKQAGVWQERTKLKNGETQLSTPTPTADNSENAEKETETNFSGERSTVEPTLPLPAPEAAAPATELPEQEAPPAAALADAAPTAAAADSNSPVAEASTAPGSSPNGDEAPKVVVFPGAGAPPQEEVKAPVLPLGVASMREFFSRLTLSERDEELLWSKRGLGSRTVEALGFKSNPRTNGVLLKELAEIFSREELEASGLWKGADRQLRKSRRPNVQFAGAGIMHKAGPDFKASRMEWVDDDKNVWGWCAPVLIPYFDEEGLLIGLRPHKGGGSASTITGTPRVYIPRGAREKSPLLPTRERFELVVVTEGEFKAAALWQEIGAGRQDGETPVGVASLPGISFAKNYEMREVLDDWLRQVRCRKVIVAFDNEEKGDPALAAYKQDRRKRFDTLIWARCLATDLANKLHIHSSVCVLPNAWRNAKGKADWDGKLAEFANERDRDRDGNANER